MPLISRVILMTVPFVTMTLYTMFGQLLSIVKASDVASLISEFSKTLILIIYNTEHGNI